MYGYSSLLKVPKYIGYKANGKRQYKKIAVAGTGYVGLSIATLLSQHHEVVAVDVIQEKWISSITATLQFRTST